MATETKAQELVRLVRAYQLGERQHRQEAWNLIADFCVENWSEICRALEDRDARRRMAN